MGFKTGSWELSHADIINRATQFLLFLLALTCSMPSLPKLLNYKLFRREKYLTMSKHKHSTSMLFLKQSPGSV